MSARVNQREANSECIALAQPGRARNCYAANEKCNSIPRRSEVNLVFESTPIVFPAVHYVFIEREGPFMQTAPAAWGQLHSLLPALGATSSIQLYLSQYRPKPPLYRAGVTVAEAPAELAGGLRYELFAGGPYYRWTLTGPYTELPEACGLAFAQAERDKLPLGEAFFLENYTKDPRVTPAAELVTEILFPAAG